MTNRPNIKYGMSHVILSVIPKVYDLTTASTTVVRVARVVARAIIMWKSRLLLVIWEFFKFVVYNNPRDSSGGLKRRRCDASTGLPGS